MKKIFTHLFLITLSLFCSNANAQLDTSNGRYYQAIFPTVTTTNNVVFGSYLNFGSLNNLTMDIYQPTGDLASVRALIILAHGGSFQFGDKNESDIVEMCQKFAKMGYVTCSINYRTGFFPIDSVNATKAVLKATQDMKAAVRFFRKDAATSNTYKIQPDYIFVGGSSAGAFMALHLAYMDKSTEFPLGAATLASLDGLEGVSGNPGYPSNARAVINLCGALGDASYLEAGDVPFVSMHGNADAVVPYAHSIIVSLGYSIMYVDGSSSIHNRANVVGVYNPFYTFNGADHVPYMGSPAYMDTTMNFVRDFLRPLVASGPLAQTDLKKSDDNFVVYPNPSAGDFSVITPNGYSNYTLLDMEGREAISGRFTSTQNSIDASALPKGIYCLKLSDQNFTQVLTKKISIR
jgi:poly(3-hydroxybutyrate) depolymerase